jgi:hypothetical protein
MCLDNKTYKPMRTLSIFVFSALLIIGCDDQEKDSFEKHWKLQSDQTDLQVSFELWHIAGEDTYRIKYTDIKDGAIEKPVVSVTLNTLKVGERITEILITGQGYELKLKDCHIDGANMISDVEYTSGTTEMLNDQIFVRN